MLKKKSNLTKREEEIRSDLLEEHARTVCFAEKHTVPYADGREKEAREILGKILDILGG